MKRSWLLLVLLALLVVVAAAGAATAVEAIEPHPHILLHELEFGFIEGAPHLLGVRECVDLANNQALPLNSHHNHIHFGETGISFGGESGHAVIAAAFFPTENQPLPWGDCAEFEALLPIPVG